MIDKGYNDKKRFRVVYEQGKFSTYRVFVDNETGVNYLFCGQGYGGGLSVLLDRDGKPIITPIER